MNQSIDIIVSGHLCLDLIPEMESVRLDQLATPGRLFETGPMRFATGGAVSNTGLALHRLGVKVRLMATVGDDLLGQMIVTSIKSHDPSLTEYITQEPGLASSYSVVMSPQRADRIFLHCPCANAAFGVRNIDFTLVGGTRIFHLGYPTLLPRLMAREGEELAAIYNRAQQTGAVTSLDMTVPDANSPSGRVDWNAVLKRALPYVDIFIPSIEEIMFMLRRSDFEAWQGRVLDHLSASYLSQLADELLEMGAAITGFKLGEIGLYIKTARMERIAALNRRLALDAAAWGAGEWYAPAYEVEVANTLGAGDSAYAGFLSALLYRMTPENAARWACAVGACNVEFPDATSGVRTWEQTQARLQAGWPTRSIRLRGTS